MELHDTQLDRFRWRDGRAKPPDHELKRFFGSVETSLGISYSEFILGNKLVADLQKIVGM